MISATREQLLSFFNFIRESLSQDGLALVTDRIEPMETAVAIFKTPEVVWYCFEGNKQ